MTADVRPFVENGIQGFLHQPSAPGPDSMVLTHGAGANCQAPLLVSLARTFADAGITVLRCDLPFRQLRPHGPPPRGSADRDQEGLRRAVESMREIHPGRIFLAGHSYGGRQASMLSAKAPELVDRLLLLSYPLHPPQRPEQLRTEHFPALATPAFFVHGSRDEFATTSELTDAIHAIPAPTGLLDLPGAGHSLVSRGKEEVLGKQILAEFLNFMGRGKGERL